MPTIKNIARSFFLISVALLLAAPAPAAQTQAVGAITVNSQVGVTVAVEAALTILPAPTVQTAGTVARALDSPSPDGRDITMLTSSGDTLADYIGTTSFTYFIRTGTVGGSGFIKLQVTKDFTPSGGPSVAAPPLARRHLAICLRGQQPWNGVQWHAVRLHLQPDPGGNVHRQFSFGEKRKQRFHFVDAVERSALRHRHLHCHHHVHNQRLLNCERNKRSASSPDVKQEIAMVIRLL